MIGDLCAAARADLEALGPLAAPLLDALDGVARELGDRPLDGLRDPAFALDLLAVVPEAALAGKLLDFLARRASSERASTAPRVTVAGAVEEYETSALGLLAAGSQRTYRTWIRRLVEAYGDRSPASVTPGDLRDLIARYVVANRKRRGPRSRGSFGEENAVAAYRHLWDYLQQKRYVTSDVAAELKKPARQDSRRRGYRREEAALVRSLASTARDPLLDELVLLCAERAVLRNVEICRLRICDVDLGTGFLKVWGKGDKERDIPLTPGLRAFLVAYIEDRRPREIPPEEWLRSTESLMRYRPSAKHPHGRACGRRYIERLLERLHNLAPVLFADGTLCLHSYRHMAGKWMEQNYGRPYKRAVLGHTSRGSATEDYGKVDDPEDLREPLTAYEKWLLDIATVQAA